MDEKKKEQKEKDQSVFLNENEESQAEKIRKEELKNESAPAGIQDKLLQELAETEDKYKRALADYQNLVRRTQEEKREWARLSNKDFILKFLPILDTLMLAEKHTKDQSFILTVGQFLQTLDQEGVVRIKTIGEEFNPHTMEAVATAAGEDGKIVDELRAGYMFYDTILRPAQVIVGKNNK